MGSASLQVTDKSKIAALARMFSASVVRELAQKGASPLLYRLTQEAGLQQSLPASTTLHEVFNTAFSILKQKANRQEYVYKTAITNKVLLGKHSLRTASMLMEFRVGSCKADIAILNGTSIAYEIKSERDRLDRLPTQVDSYRDVFAKVYVVVGSNHVRAVLNTVHKDVGVLELSDRYQLSTVREATDRADEVIPEAIFDSLRLHESKRILERLGMHVPDVPNTQIYRTLRTLFRALRPRDVHDAMVKELRSSRSLKRWNELAPQIPESLTAAVFCAPISKADYPRLLDSFSTTLSSVTTWD